MCNSACALVIKVSGHMYIIAIIMYVYEGFYGVWIAA